MYEQVQEHKEKGGSLALHANALGAMDLIDPAIMTAYLRKANNMLEDNEREMATQVILAEGDIAVRWLHGWGVRKVGSPSRGWV